MKQYVENAALLSAYNYQLHLYQFDSTANILFRKIPNYTFYASLIFVFSSLRVCILTEIINKVKEPPPLCRPILSVDEAPLDVIQFVKQAWSEEPERRPTFEEVFKQVKK